MIYGLETAHLNPAAVVATNGGTGGLGDILGSITDLATAAGTIILATKGQPANGPANPATQQAAQPTQSTGQAVSQSLQSVPVWAWLVGAGVIGIGVIVALK